MNSRAKGQRGELEFAAYLQERGHAEAKRGQQFAGGVDSPDVRGGPDGLHFECKRTEKFRLYDAVDQAVKDSDGKLVPVVAHRCSSSRSAKRGCRGSWLAVMTMDDFLSIYEELMSYRELKL